MGLSLLFVFGGIVILCILFPTFDGYRLESSINEMKPISRNRRSITDADIQYNINYVEYRLYQSIPIYNQKSPRSIPVFFAFDQSASAQLNNNLQHGQDYINHLVSLVNQYTAHANIQIINANVEMWTDKDRISFISTETYQTYQMQDYLNQFQQYLKTNKQSFFDQKKYAMGLLISNKASVYGGLTYSGLCTPDASSIVMFRDMPWKIGPLVAHELAHTMSAVDTPYLNSTCSDYPKLSFCSSGKIPASCLCDGTDANYQSNNCLMTHDFSNRVKAAMFTSCDIEMITYFASYYDNTCITPHTK